MASDEGPFEAPAKGPAGKQGKRVASDEWPFEAQGGQGKRERVGRPNNWRAGLPKSSQASSKS